MCSCTSRVGCQNDTSCESCGNTISPLEEYYNTLIRVLGHDIKRKCFYCEEYNAVLFPFYCSHFAFCYGCAVIHKGKFTFLACLICHKRRNKSFHYLIGGDKNIA